MQKSHRREGVKNLLRNPSTSNSWKFSFTWPYHVFAAGWWSPREGWTVWCLHHWPHHLLWVTICHHLQNQEYSLYILSVARRKTIYEYHRLNMKDKHIRNETAIVFSALETCNMHKVQIFNTSPWVSMFDKSGINLFPTRTAPPALQPPRTMPTRPTLSVVGAQSWGGAQMGRTEIGKIGSSANVTSTMSPSLKCAIHQDRLFNFCLLSCYQNCQWRIQMHTSMGSRVYKNACPPQAPTL